MSSFTSYQAYDSGMPIYEPIDNNSWQDTTENTYNVALIGAAGVGKSSILRRLCGQPFDPRYEPTDGSFMYVVHFPEVKLVIKEYSGQSRFQAYDDDFDAVLAVTTASNRDTRIAQEMLRKFPGLPYCMVENKSDIKVTNHNMFCSAKTQQNLLDPFLDLISQLQ